MPSSKTSRLLRYALMILPFARPAERALEQAQQVGKKIEKAVMILIAIFGTALFCLVIIALYAAVRLWMLVHGG